MFYFWLLMNLAVIFDAIGDALLKKSGWVLAKTFQMLMILSFAIMIVLAQYLNFKITQWPNWFLFILMYGLIRVGLFNAVWGIVRHGIKYWNWYYLGRTSLWDRSLEWIITRMGFPTKHFLFWIYLISWVVSIGILFNEFYIVL